MAGFDWIHIRFRSFDLVLWHRFQQRNLISRKSEKQKNQHNQNTSYHKKTFYIKIHQETNTKKANINQSKPGVCAVLLVFLFAMLWHVSWFNPLLFKKAAGFKTFFHYKEHQNKLLLVYSLWIKRSQIKNVWKEGGTGSFVLGIHFWVWYD